MIMRTGRIYPTLLYGIFVCCLLACHSKNEGREKKTGYDAQILFQDSVHDFGVLQSGKAKYEYVFRFTNIAETPAVILNVKPACRCITVEYSRNVILQGEQGYVKVVYDGTTSSAGYFDKAIQVHINAMKPYTLRVKGNLVMHPAAF